MLPPKKKIKPDNLLNRLDTIHKIAASTLSGKKSVIYKLSKCRLYTNSGFSLSDLQFCYAFLKNVVYFVFILNWNMKIDYFNCLNGISVTRLAVACTFKQSAMSRLESFDTLDV